MINPWFENEEFVKKILSYGLGKFIENGATNSRGVMNYLTDKTHEVDAIKIAQLVKEHNKQDKE